MVPPVEGVAGGGTAYGWDEGLHDPGLLRGTIDPTKVPSAELMHVWCMPSTANVGLQDMPRQMEPVSVYSISVIFTLNASFLASYVLLCYHTWHHQRLCYTCYQDPTTKK